MAKLLRFMKTWVIEARAVRRSDSEVLEPRWRVTFGRVERNCGLGVVEVRVRTRNLSLWFAARAVTCG
jgi:hypothetical protein